VQLYAQQLILGLATGCVYALIAIGYTMVYGVLRLINFAHGDILMVGAYVAYFVILQWHLPMELALPVAMVACAVLGATIERLAYRPLRNHPRLTLLITAIGVSLFLEYGGQLFLGPDPKAFPVEQAGGPVTAAFARVSDWISNASGIILPDYALLIMVASVALMIGLHALVMRSKIGLAMRAVSYDQRTAALMGVNIDRVILTTFLIGSSLAGAGGVMLAAYEPSITPLMGLLPGLKAFTAAVLGGIGNIPGAMLGGLVMGVAESFVSGSAALSAWRDAVAFFILILILLVKPTGLTGRGAVEKV